MNLFVTGSSGGIGSVMVSELSQRYNVTGFDRREPEAAPEGYRFVRGDVLDRVALSEAMAGADAILHLAAIPFDIPPLHEVLSINLQGTYNVLELGVEHGVECLLHASSVMAYGFGQNAVPEYLPVDETHPVRANRTYGLSKILAERVCRSFTERCGIRTICFRLTAAVATDSSYGMLPFSDSVGELGLYQYFDVRDFVDMAALALEAKHLDHEVFLVSAVDSGRDEPTPQVIDRFFPDAELRYDELEASSSFVSIDKARKLLAFEPKYSWRDR